MAKDINVNLEVKLRDSGQLELVEIEKPIVQRLPDRIKRQRKAKLKAKRQVCIAARFCSNRGNCSGCSDFENYKPRRNCSPRFIGLWSSNQSTLFVTGSARVQKIYDYCALDYEHTNESIAMPVLDYNAVIQKHQNRFKRGKNWRTKPVKIK